MNTDTLATIERAAPFLATNTAKKAADYLQSPLQLSLAVLTVLSDGEPATCKEIAAEISTQPAWYTVNQILLALRRGGIVLMSGHGNPESRTWQLPKGRIQHKKID